MADPLAGQFYTVEEVAEKLRVTRQTVYNWMKEGSLEFYKLKGQRRVSSAQLLAFLQKGQDEDADQKNRQPGRLAA